MKRDIIETAVIWAVGFIIIIVGVLWMNAVINDLAAQNHDSTASTERTR